MFKSSCPPWEEGTVTEFTDPQWGPGFALFLTPLHGVPSHTLKTKCVLIQCTNFAKFQRILKKLYKFLRPIYFSLAFEQFPFLVSSTLDNLTYLVLAPDDYNKGVGGEVVYNSLRACALLAG